MLGSLGCLGRSGRTWIATLCAAAIFMGCGDPQPERPAQTKAAEARPKLVKVGFLAPTATLAEKRAHWIGALDAALRMPEPFQDGAVEDVMHRTGWSPDPGERTVASLGTYIDEHPARVALFTSASREIVARVAGRYGGALGIQGAELRDDGHVLLYVGATPETQIIHRGTWTVDGLAELVRVRGLEPSDPTRVVTPVELPADSDWRLDVRMGTITIDLGDGGIQPILERESR